MDVFQFTLKNDTFRFSVYNNYHCHDTGRSIEPIFMKFTWLVRVHTWVRPIFGNNQFNRTADKGGNVTGFLAFIQPVWGFEEKISKPYLVPHFPTEEVIFIFVI